MIRTKTKKLLGRIWAEPRSFWKGSHCGVKTSSRPSSSVLLGVRNDRERYSWICLGINSLLPSEMPMLQNKLWEQTSSSFMSWNLHARMTMFIFPSVVNILTLCHGHLKRRNLHSTHRLANYFLLFLLCPFFSFHFLHAHFPHFF